MPLIVVTKSYNLLKILSLRITNNTEFYISKLWCLKLMRELQFFFLRLVDVLVSSLTKTVCLKVGEGFKTEMF